MKRIALVVVLASLTLAAAPKKKSVAFDPKLPVLGTQFHTLPDGKGKDLVEAKCLPCHSADMLVQQRLTEKQWTAEIDKMTKWGATVTDADKAPMIEYLAKHFSVENKTFAPKKTRPAGY